MSSYDYDFSCLRFFFHVISACVRYFSHFLLVPQTAVYFDFLVAFVRHAPRCPSTTPSHTFSIVSSTPRELNCIIIRIRYRRITYTQHTRLPRDFRNAEVRTTMIQLVNGSFDIAEAARNNRSPPRNLTISGISQPIKGSQSVGNGGFVELHLTDLVSNPPPHTAMSPSNGKVSRHPTNNGSNCVFVRGLRCESNVRFDPRVHSRQYILPIYPVSGAPVCVKAAASKQTSDCFRIEEEEEAVEGKKGKAGRHQAHRPAEV